MEYFRLFTKESHYRAMAGDWNLHWYYLQQHVLCHM